MCLVSAPLATEDEEEWDGSDADTAGGKLTESGEESDSESEVIVAAANNLASLKARTSSAGNVYKAQGMAAQQAHIGKLMSLGQNAGVGKPVSAAPKVAAKTTASNSKKQNA